MKYCEEYAALLDAFYDGECTPDEAEQVRRHLAECPGCRAYLDELAIISAGFPGEEDVEVPEGFADGVMAAIRAGAAPRKRPARWKKLLPMAACLAIVLVSVSRVPEMVSGGGNRETASPAAAAPAASAPAAAECAPAAEEEMSFTAAESPAAGEPAQPAEDGAAAGKMLEDHAEVEQKTTNQTVTYSGGTESAVGTVRLEQWFAEAVLTAEEADGLTEGWPLLEETAEARIYTLTRTQYAALCQALEDLPAPVDEGELALVTVTN